MTKAMSPAYRRLPGELKHYNIVCGGLPVQMPRNARLRAHSGARIEILQTARLLDDGKQAGFRCQATNCIAFANSYFSARLKAEGDWSMFVRRTLALAFFTGAVLAGCGASAVPGANAGSGASPSSVLHSLAVMPMHATTPTIKHVSKIQAEQTQNIIIKGKGFGKMQPYNGDSCCIQFVVSNPACYYYGSYGTWQAGYEGSGNEVTLNVTKWTNREIIVAGFTGPYGEYCWSLVSGQMIKLNIWNAQSQSGPATWTGTIQ